MPSEKLTRILRSKSPFSEDEITALTEAQGWDWVYANEAATKDRSEQICFTGFGAVECAEVEGLAAKSGWLKVVGSVTGKLAFLCVGDNPGPAKLEKGTRQGVTIIDRGQFAKLLADGELPPLRQIGAKAIGAR